jgi:integrase/recombinase XerD
MAWLQRIPSNTGNYYVVLWLPNQKRKRALTTGTKNIVEAEKILKRVNELEHLRKAEDKVIKLIYADIQADKGLIDDLNELLGTEVTITLEKAGEMFLKSRGQQIKPSTYVSYSRAMEDVKQALGKHIRITDLKMTDYDQLLGYLMNQYVTSTVNIRLRSIRAFLNWCVEYGYLTKAPFRFRMLKNDQLPKFLKPEEVRDIYRQITDPVMNSIFKIYEHTGIRLSELYNSELDVGFLKVMGKGDKERYVPLSKDFVEHYQIALASGYSTDRISRGFTIAWRKSLINKHPEYIKERKIPDLSEKQVKNLTYRILEEIHAGKLGKKNLSKEEKREAHATGKTLHCFRHTFAVRNWIATGDINLVKELLGHSTVGMTEKYTRFPKDYLKRILSESN